jgi:hypothetical protein
LIAAVAFNDGLWLLGNRRGEAWYYSGDALFPFQQQAGVLIEHGCVAKYSVATTDKALFWLTQDKDGKALGCERVDRLCCGEGFDLRDGRRNPQIRQMVGCGRLLLPAARTHVLPA